MHIDVTGKSFDNGFKCTMRDVSNNFAKIYQWSLIIFGILFPIFVISTLNLKIFLAIRSRLKYTVKESTPNCSTDSSMFTICQAEDSSGVKTSSMCSEADTGPTTNSKRKIKRKPLTKQDRGLLNILMVVTLTFVLLNTPQVLRGSIYYLSVKRTLNDSQRSVKHFGWAFTNTLSTINYAVNFFLYCFSSRKFRQDLNVIIGSFCKFFNAESN